MAPAAAVPPAPETMSPNQLARRRRVLEAVIGLVADGGIEEMQMRELAERSGVALGTVYRYFSSKDHVVAAALVEWAGQLDQSVSSRPLPSGTMAERLKALLRQGVRPFRREPNFAALMMRAASSNRPVREPVLPGARPDRHRHAQPCAARARRRRARPGAAGGRRGLVHGAQRVGPRPVHGGPGARAPRRGVRPAAGLAGTGRREPPHRRRMRHGAARRTA